jgi:hypothetical protein
MTRHAVRRHLRLVQFDQVLHLPTKGMTLPGSLTPFKDCEIKVHLDIIYRLSLSGYTLQSYPSWDRAYPYQGWNSGGGPTTSRVGCRQPASLCMAQPFNRSGPARWKPASTRSGYRMSQAHPRPNLPLATVPRFSHEPTQGNMG